MIIGPKHFSKLKFNGNENESYRLIYQDVILVTNIEWYVYKTMSTFFYCIIVITSSFWYTYGCMDLLTDIYISG